MVEGGAATLNLLLLPQIDNDGYGRDEVTCNMPVVPTDSTTLMVMTLELMRRKILSEDRYFAADLFMRVPALAGLGGDRPMPRRPCGE
jgi:hypothetical protein